MMKVQQPRPQIARGSHQQAHTAWDFR
jgi:hypothetical protein